MRLSASSFAGTARTLVAVGSSSDACMFLAIAFAAPRSGVTDSSVDPPSAALAGEVDPAAGLLSPLGSADAPFRDSFGAGFSAVFCCVAVSEDRAGALPFDDPDDDAEPFAEEVFAAPAVPDPLEPLRSPRLAPDPAEPDAEVPPDAPVEEVEPAPATLDPSSGA
ncbi:hypothetical protein Acsp07_44000 [Actinomycetospora sp. NBRC 106378]|nr:hypothetical protein Acsp07_44000 [Actinomycetospora sp. NBRC 106378]